MAAAHLPACRCAAAPTARASLPGCSSHPACKPTHNTLRKLVHCCAAEQQPVCVTAKLFFMPLHRSECSRPAAAASQFAHLHVPKKGRHRSPRPRPRLLQVGKKVGSVRAGQQQQHELLHGAKKQPRATLSFNTLLLAPAASPAATLSSSSSPPQQQQQHHHHACLRPSSSPRA